MRAFLGSNNLWQVNRMNLPGCHENKPEPKRNLGWRKNQDGGRGHVGFY